MIECEYSVASYSIIIQGISNKLMTRYIGFGVVNTKFKPFVWDGQFYCDPFVRGRKYLKDIHL